MAPFDRTRALNSTGSTFFPLRVRRVSSAPLKFFCPSGPRRPVLARPRSLRTGRPRRATPQAAPRAGPSVFDACRVATDARSRCDRGVPAPLGPMAAWPEGRVCSPPPFQGPPAPSQPKDTGQGTRLDSVASLSPVPFSWRAAAEVGRMQGRRAGQRRAYWDVREELGRRCLTPQTVRWRQRRRQGGWGLAIWAGRGRAAAGDVGSGRGKACGKLSNTDRPCRGRYPRRPGGEASSPCRPHRRQRSAAA